ncbi:hypothetical protein Vi05172_g13070 [Venturia inaequalis]|nr:hypothetical protein Vi05172_g13070 [Venturia inaequalis]
MHTPTLFYSIVHISSGSSSASRASQNFVDINPRSNMVN